MFPEYRDLITRLKTEGTNQRFLNLFEKHHDLDHKIKSMEHHDAGGIHTEIETMKKEKLALKDQIYTILREEAEAESK